MFLFLPTNFFYDLFMAKFWFHIRIHFVEAINVDGLKNSRKKFARILTEN